MRPVIYGAAYSVYVRAVRLTLEEKGVSYDLVPVDAFAEGGPPAEHLERHPFGRIPAFEFGDLRLYETSAITRFIDEAFPGPSLQPLTPIHRARLNQVLSILDAYVYRTLVWDIYVERVARPKQDREPDEDRIRAALPKARICLKALEQLMGAHPFLAGVELTLGDLYAAPMFAYFVRAPEAKPLLGEYPVLASWWERISTRRSMEVTAFPEEGEG